MLRRGGLSSMSGETVAPPATHCHSDRPRSLVMPPRLLPRGVEPELLQAELENVDEPAGPIAEGGGFQQRLLLELVEVEILGQEVDERLVVHPGLDEVRLAARTSGPLQVPEDEISDPGSHARWEHVPRRVTPADDRLPVGRTCQLAVDHELAQSAQHDVEASVGKLLGPRQLTDRPDAEDLRRTGVVLLPVTAQ